MNTKDTNFIYYLWNQINFIMTIIDVVRKFKFSILLVISFVLLENISWIIEPTFFGNLLDAMIDRFYDKEKVNYMLPLLFWVLIYLINVAGGTLHRLFSGKIYAKIYADTATNVINYSRKKGLPHLHNIRPGRPCQRIYCFPEGKVAGGYMAIIRHIRGHHRPVLL